MGVVVMARQQGQPPMEGARMPGPIPGREESQSC